MPDQLDLKHNWNVYNDLLVLVYWFWSSIILPCRFISWKYEDVRNMDRYTLAKWGVIFIDDKIVVQIMVCYYVEPEYCKILLWTEHHLTIQLCCTACIISSWVYKFSVNCVDQSSLVLALPYKQHQGIEAVSF